VAAHHGVLDSSPLSFHQLISILPACSYHPVDDACWCKGESVPYQALASTFDHIEALSKRLEIIAALRNFFR
jgi:hypothetical protein